MGITIPQSYSDSIEFQRSPNIGSADEIVHGSYYGETTFILEGSALNY
jgi:hypothetical protein